MFAAVAAPELYLTAHLASASLVSVSNPADIIALQMMPWRNKANPGHAATASWAGHYQL